MADMSKMFNLWSSPINGAEHCDVASPADVLRGSSRVRKASCFSWKLFMWLRCYYRSLNYDERCKLFGFYTMTFITGKLNYSISYYCRMIDVVLLKTFCFFSFSNNFFALSGSH